MQIRNITPNQTGSMPSVCTMGMKIGSVIIIMLIWSTKMPRKISISIMPAMIIAGGQALAGDELHQPVAGARERQDLREGGGAQDDEQDHPRDAGRALERLQQRVPASARGRPAPAPWWRRRRAPRIRSAWPSRRPARRPPRRRSTASAARRRRTAASAPSRCSALRLSSAGASCGRDAHPQHDPQHEGDRQDDAGQHAADQQLGDRDARQRAEQHRQRRGRDQHVHRADRHDRARWRCVGW